MKSIIAVKDNQGEVFTMPSDSPKCILEVHYSTSYIQFVVQDHYVNEGGGERFPTKNIVVILEDTNWVDLIAVRDDEIGEIVNLISN